MDKKQQVEQKRARRGLAEVKALHADFQQSGLSVGEYCRLHSVSRSSLSAIVARRQVANIAIPLGASVSRPVESAGTSSARRQTPPAKVAPHAHQTASAFVPVDIVAADAHGPRNSLHVELPHGVRIEVARGFDEETLLRLLAALGHA